jgi:hypothetical protein
VFRVHLFSSALRLFLSCRATGSTLAMTTSAWDNVSSTTG